MDAGRLFGHVDFFLDTNTRNQPKLTGGDAIRAGLRHAATRPFRVVPFFDPGPWGGQWMKEVCDLDRSVPNFAWCFDCVPEENSLLLGFGQHRVELPSIDLVTLGEKIYRGGIADRMVPACAGCHGPSGSGIPAQYPRLSGQHADYTAAQLNAFRSGARANSPQMTGVAAKMNDKEIKAVSDYIAGLH